MNITIHITSTTDTLTTAQPIEAEFWKEEDLRQSLDKPHLQRTTTGSSLSTPPLAEVDDIPFGNMVTKELGLKTGRVEVIDEKPTSNFKTVPGRPDIERIVREVVGEADDTDIVAVGGRF